MIINAADQHISSTCSRRLRHQKDFLAAIEDLVRTHPAATDTTLRVARDFAARMPRSRDGHVAYGLQGMMRRLGLARSTIAAHVAILRELGLLAWVSHGSSHNILRSRLGERFRAGSGYRGTATIYACCAPPAWDRARGMIRQGHGYRSRIRAYTPSGQAQAIVDARKRQAARAVRRTPSYTAPPTDLPAPVVGENKTPAVSQTPGSTSTATRNGGRRRSTGYSAQETKTAIAYAQRLRLEVWWTRAACVRRLAFALRPLILAGYTSSEAARELASWRMPHRPKNPAGYLRAELQRRAHAGLLVLPEGSVAARPQAPADDEGRGYRAMLARRVERFGPAYTRYREQLAAPLRAAVRALASPAKTEQPARWPLRWREPEEEFFASLPPQASPREVYRARVVGAAVPAPRDSAPAEERTWAELADHAQATAAFSRLRAALAAPTAPAESAVSR
ncbi:hypothetical protein ACH4UR_25170 [Streptomyces lydicus]|uniref:hypothetical protein n=1 Tax=Streptomyces lydicus TaxID=47763 RepID=UPI0033E98D0E